MQSSNRVSPGQLVLPNDIVSRIRSGDAAAFKEMFDAGFAPLVRFAYGIVGSYDDARDIVQQVFVNIFHSARDFNPRGSLAAYLYKAVRNASLNWIRDSGIHQRAIDKVANDTSALEQLSQEQFSSIDEFLGSLSERQRTAINLRFIEQRTIAETAEVLGISTTAVDKLITRAIKAIREQHEDR